jgi:hypothetical protein
MRNLQKLFGVFILISIFALSVGAQPVPEGTTYAAIEQEGTICGYVESTVTYPEIDGGRTMLIKGLVEFKIAALGADVNARIETETRVDPTSGKFYYSAFDLEQGTVKMGTTAVIENDTAIISTRPDGKVKKVPLPPDVLLENMEYFPHLIRDFVEKGMDEKEYKALDLMDGAIHDVVYVRQGIEELTLVGKTYQAMVLKKIDKTNGVKQQMYINNEDGVGLKTVLPTRTIYLADASVKEKVTRVSVDDHLIAKTDVKIPNFTDITYLKVEATLEPGGLWLTEESLNIPGQKFEGTVKDNLIEGIFEVSHSRYDGSNAPPFPADFSGDATLEKYLNAEDLIESDDPVLIKQAQEITEGSKDSWEAFYRLSQWVADEISYDIPGGGSARNTYDIRLGECGAHSRLLTAFSRAVGIPCRVIWGCMYVPDYGGGFGQHGWNEVYMGDAGWIPVDATAKEIDYVDSGHLRIGELASKATFLAPKEMKILDFQAGEISMASAAKPEVPEQYKKYLGKYQGPHAAFEILVQNSSLAVDIPGKMIFELKDPDSEGKWYFKLTDDASITFEENDAAEVTGMTLISRTRLPRSTAAETTQVNTADVPSEFVPYLGQYVVPMRNMNLEVIYQEDNLAVNDPTEGIIKLTGPDENNQWLDQFEKNKVSFDMGDNGLASAMFFYNIVNLPRAE